MNETPGDDVTRDGAIEARAIPWKWLAVILTGVVLALVGGWATDITRRTSANEINLATQGARIAILEKGLDSLISRTERIDGKLDTLILGKEHRK